MTISTANSYELAARAMRLHESITCGPNGRTCDGAKPTYTCPAHGGARKQDDGTETVDDRQYREEYERRWTSEVLR